MIGHSSHLQELPISCDQAVLVPDHDQSAVDEYVLILTMTAYHHLYLLEIEGLRWARTPISSGRSR